MSETPPPPTPPAAPKTGVPRWVWAVFGGAAVVIIGLVAAVVVLLAKGDSTDSTATSKPEAKTMTVAGTFLLTSADVRWDTDGSCYGTKGYDDISGGAQVVVRNNAGETVGVGALDPGTKQSSVQCVFRFTVSNVPAGLGIYSVEISHRGQISFQEDRARNLSLTLG